MKKKSQSPKVPGKLLLLGENETFLAKQENGELSIAASAAKLAQFHLIDTGCLLLTVTVSAHRRSDQICLRDDSEPFPPLPKKPGVCEWVSRAAGRGRAAGSPGGAGGRTRRRGGACR